jgi:hypothetical protein
MVILKGASGSGKAAIAEAIAAERPSVAGYCIWTVQGNILPLFASFLLMSEQGGDAVGLVIGQLPGPRPP